MRDNDGAALQSMENDIILYLLWILCNYYVYYVLCLLALYNVYIMHYILHCAVNICIIIICS